MYSTVYLYGSLHVAIVFTLRVTSPYNVPWSSTDICGRGSTGLVISVHYASPPFDDLNILHTISMSILMYIQCHTVCNTSTYVHTYVCTILDYIYLSQLGA